VGRKSPRPRPGGVAAKGVDGWAERVVVRVWIGTAALRLEVLGRRDAKYLWEQFSFRWRNPHQSRESLELSEKFISG
jgi:hypothetical protein